jgi:endo-1,4-beta-xylanase
VVELHLEKVIMRTTHIRLLGVTAVICLSACSSSNDLTPTSGGVGGAEGIGGASNVATGGASHAPGSSAATGGTSVLNTTSTLAATGGKVGAGGALATGGKASSGGATATGGKVSTGGEPSTGGTTATGAGGAQPTGGANAAGGAGGKSSTKTSGGAPTATGGTNAAGSTTGGSTSAPGTTVKFVGNITTSSSVDPSGLTYHKYWDQITPENEGKWGSVQSSPTSSFNWKNLDSISTYTKTNNIIFKHHCFFWGSQQPSPMSSITEAQAENWVKSFCERYPNAAVIDVVNEPPPHTTPGYTSALGAGEKGSYPWIVKAFKLARQYCPNAILVLNDYNNIENSDETHFISIVTDIKSNGAPIDAVGAQSHGLKGMSASTVKSNLEKLNSQTGLPVYITEFDIDDGNDSSQSTTYQNLFPVFLDASYIHGITVWGWIASHTWETNSGIVNGTTPRPAMTWLMQKLGRPVPPN